MSKRHFTSAQIAAMVAIATLCSNLLGFVREMIMANYFGAGMITDAYVMALSIPTTLLAAVFSAMGTAFMPILASRFETEGIDSANKFTSNVISLMFVVVGIVFVLAQLFPNILVSLFAPGYDGEKQALTVYYLRFALLTLFCLAGTSFLDSYLKYRGVFSAQKFIAILQNVFAITFIWIAAHGDYHVMIFGVVIGYIISLIGQGILAAKNGFKYSLGLTVRGPVKEVLILALPVFIGGSFSELNTFIDKMLASTLIEGSVTALNYSGKIVTLVFTFTVSIFSMIIYPKLNQAFAKGETERISDLTERGINLLSVLSIPFTFGAALYATPLVQVVFERGAFSGTATGLVAVSFFYYILRTPFYAVSSLLNNAFYSMKETRAAVICSIVAVLTNISLNFVLVGPLGVAGLAIATSVAELVGMITRCLLFRKKHPDIKILKSKRKLAKIVIFSIIAVGISYGVYMLLAGLSSLIIRLGIAVCSAMLVYLIMLYFAKFDELNFIRDLFSRG